MVLVDTSVWVDHLRNGDARLAALLERNQVAMHPMVSGELACGNLRDRDTLRALWGNRPPLAAASHEQALWLLDRNRVWGRGIGYVDLHLLTAVSLSQGAALWTHDRRLQGIAGALGLARGLQAQGF